MFKPNIAIHKGIGGELEVLAVSENADVVLDAFRQCTKSGEVAAYVRPAAEKRRKIAGAPAAKKAAKKKVS